jgi:hypothetical protein
MGRGWLASARFPPVFARLGAGGAPGAGCPGTRCRRLAVQLFGRWRHAHGEDARRQAAVSPAVAHGLRGAALGAGLGLFNALLLCVLLFI